MKALFYNHTGRASGAERVLILALQGLDRALVEPGVICPEGELAREVTSLDIPVKTIPELNARFTVWPHKLVVYAFSLMRTVWALRSEIRSSGAELVHANSPRAGLAALFATAGTSLPVIWHVHDELRPHPITTFIRWVATSSRRCSIIAVSGATARSFIGDSGKPNGRVRVIHNAVDIAAIDVESRGGSMRDELGLAHDDFLFGIVGQITPRKGQLELVKAFGEAAADMPSAKLVVIGSAIFDHDALYREQVLEMATSLGLSKRVRFLGHRPDALRLMQELDTLVINSTTEAFVMVGLEAMACRTPVIATDVGGTNEMIADGLNGLLIPQGDKPALIDALKEMYADAELRERFAQRSRERVEKEFNIDRFTRAFHSALMFVAAEQPAANSLKKRGIRPVRNT